MSSWLGIDHGTKRLGVAVGDTASGIASPLEVLAAQPAEQAIRRIGELARQYSVAGVVVGLPLNMDGTEGPQAALARQLADQIAQAGWTVRMFDERLSSFAADQALAGMLTRKKKKARQDAVAAATMLQDFLAAQNR
ncbi:MAG: Holliday junction resolvase RuvX [Phycisphaerae bacterium]|jgi:putative Holliday junction resolvase